MLLFFMSLKYKACLKKKIYSEQQLHMCVVLNVGLCPTEAEASDFN